MAKSIPRYVGDERVRAQLEAYACPTPFHAARTLFLGNIATPRLDASPLEAIRELWGGELPEFESEGEINVLFEVLSSFWNHLAVHQSRTKPFRLQRQRVEPNPASLARLSQVRVEELDRFVDGLFGKEERLDLPERAVEGMERIGQARALFAASLKLLRKTSDESPDPRHEETRTHLRELSRHVEGDIQGVILACVRLRREHLEALTVSRPTLH